MNKDVVWRKSSYSNGQAECVEVARGGASVAIRDSKNPDGPRVTCADDVWSDFVASLKDRA